MHRALFTLCCLLLSATILSAKNDTAVVLKTATGRLYGSFAGAPPAGSPHRPLVLIVPDAGPLDRDGNTMIRANNAYRFLADSLARHGIASFRFDKRGIGASKAGVSGEADLRFDFYAADVAGWIKLLQQDARFSKIVVLGHGEGALVAAIALQERPCAGFISVGATAIRADSFIVRQLGGTGNMPPAMLDSIRMYFRMLRNGEAIRNVPRQYMSLFRPGVLDYLSSWIKWSPVDELQKVKSPTLIIRGATDLEIPPADYELLLKAKPDADSLTIPGMNHIFRRATTDADENFTTYINPRLPVDAALVAAVVDFVRRR